MDTKAKLVKYACYTSSLSMSVVGNLPALLYITFRNLYGISYSLLGLLAVIFFFTQLIIDLIFSFFSHKFNIPATVKAIPFITLFGMILYAASPVLFPDNVYVGLVLGTIVFSSAAGLGEVLISPVIAALPSDDPDREMSKLHSVYAWGVVPVILLSTLFLLLFGGKMWQVLVVIFMIVPILSALLFFKAEIPPMETPEKVSGALILLKNKGVILCFFAIFLGGAAECTMAQWASGYIEQALGIDKIWGDVFGVALFGAMLGLGRTAYAKVGKGIEKVLFFGSAGAAVCYLAAAFVPVPAVGLVACGITGLCVSMLWPGTLIVASDRFPKGGVFIYALMAAGGDMGASAGPQLVGLVTDFAISNAALGNTAMTLGLAPEQLGMKLGMLVGALFPIAAIFVFGRIARSPR